MNYDRTFQLIFVLETTKKAKIDYYYVSEIVDKFVEIGENKVSYIFLGGKHNYNKPKIVQEINKQVTDYRIISGGKSYILFVLDRDKSHLLYDDLEFEKNLVNYCQKNNYSIIWFNNTIEEVMLKRKIEDKDKKQEAYKFFNNREINKFKSSKFLAPKNSKEIGRSNFLTILKEIINIEKDT